MLKTYKHPPGPGVYAEHVTPEGFIRIYPVTEAQVAKRHAVAEALGFVRRNPCSFRTSGYPSACPGEGPRSEGKHQHFTCYESKELTGRGFAQVHHVHDRPGVYTEGVTILSWPEAVARAVEAAEAVEAGEALDAQPDEDETPWDADYDEGDPDLVK